MVEELHELQSIGDQQICLHLIQMFFIKKSAHAGEPFRLFQNEDIGVLNTGCREHSCEREAALLFFKLLQSAGVIAADRRILGLGFRRCHHGGSHFALKCIAVLQYLITLLIGITQAGQHVACRIHIAGLCPPAVCAQILIIHGILEDQRRRSDIDSVVIRIVWIGCCKNTAQRQCSYKRVGVGQIFCHILNAVHCQQRGDNIAEGLDTGSVSGIPVKPHLIVILHQLLAVGNVRIGKLLIALEDSLEFAVDLQLTLRKSIIGDITGRNCLGSEPVMVYGGMEVISLGEPVELTDVFNQIRTDPGICAC